MRLTGLIFAHTLLGEEPLRLLLDQRSQELPDENGVPQLFEARPLSAEAGDADDSGQDVREFGVADIDHRLWNVLLDNIGGDEPVRVTQIEWNTEGMTTRVTHFELDDAEIDLSAAFTFSGATPDVDFAAPFHTWNRRNTPQLRR